MSDKKAFRCKKCGHLEPAEHAGDRSVPLACSVCNGGIKFDTSTGAKSANSDNWEVLADSTDQRLRALGLTRTAVCRHVGAGDLPAESGRRVEASAGG